MASARRRICERCQFEDQHSSERERLWDRHCVPPIGVLCAGGQSRFGCRCDGWMIRRYQMLPSGRGITEFGYRSSSLQRTRPTQASSKINALEIYWRTFGQSGSFAAEGPSCRAVIRRRYSQSHLECGNGQGQQQYCGQHQTGVGDQPHARIPMRTRFKRRTDLHLPLQAANKSP
jgi:hypothetical protein